MTHKCMRNMHINLTHNIYTHVIVINILIKLYYKYQQETSYHNLLTTINSTKNRRRKKEKRKLASLLQIGEKNTQSRSERQSRFKSSC
jgi:hypothetical protein